MAEIRIQVVLDQKGFWQGVAQVDKKIAELNGKKITIGSDSLPRVSASVQQTKGAMDDLGTSVHKTGETFKQSATKMLRWMAIGNSIATVKRAFNDAFSMMKAVDAELVNTAKATDITDDELKQLSTTAYELATKFGRLADDVLTATTAFARAGYKDQLVEMTELALLTQNVGDLTEKQATQFLLAADAAWKLNGDTTALTSILDGMNNLTNKNATDMVKLADGITLAGSVFANAGESAQTFAALLGAGTAATQRSGSEIARGLRTILMNIRQIRGETADGELIDGESIAKASKALKEFAGISTIVDGELRKGSDVLAELASKWGDLGSVAQSAIAEALANKRQANILTALMDNWQLVEKQIVDYANGAGSALKENERYLDSWASKSNILKAAWTEFIAETVDADTIKGFLEGTTTVVDAIGSLGTAMAGVLGFTLAAKLPVLTKELHYLTQGLKKGEDGTSAFGRALKGMKGSTASAQAGIAVLTTAIMTAVIAYNAWEAAQEKALSAAADSAQKATKDYETLNDLIKQYKDLAGDGGIGTDTIKQAEAKSIQERIVELVGEQATGLDLVNGKYETMLGLLGGIVELQAEKTLGELQAAYDTAADSIGSLMGGIFSSQFGSVSLSGLAGPIGEYVKTLKHIQVADYSLGTLKFTGIDGASEALEAFDELKAFRDYLQDTEQTGDPIYKDLNKAITEYTPKVKEATVAQNSYFDAVIKSKTGSELTAQSISDAAYAFVVEKDMGEADAKAVYARRDALIALYDTQSKAPDADPNDPGAPAKSISEQKTYSQAVSDVQVLQRAQKELNETGKVSEITFRQMERTFGDLSEVSREVNGEYKFMTGALDDMLDSAFAWFEEWGEGIPDMLRADEIVRELADDATSLANELEGATEALKAYNEATKGAESGDPFEQYRDAFEKMKAQGDAGLFGGNELRAGIDLLLPTETLKAFGYDYQALYAYIKANPFLTAAFGGEDGDYGISAMDYLIKNMGEVRDESGELIASFSRVGNETEFVINDIEALAERLGVSSDVVMSAVGAWGMFDGQLITNSEDMVKALEKMGEGVSTLENGMRKVDTVAFAQGMADAGASGKTIAQMLYQLRELAKDPENKIEIKAEDEEALATIKKIETEAGNTTKEPYTAKLDVDDQFTPGVDSATSKGEAFAGKSFIAKVGFQQTGSLPSAPSSIFSGWSGAAGATGTENAKGGPTLVNEKGGELISQDGYAFIANNGKPAIVDLKPGAIVLTAEETKGALAGSRAPSVTINAAAGGVLGGIIGKIFGAITTPQKDPEKPSGGGRKSSVLQEEKETPDWWKIIEEHYDHAVDTAQRAIDKLQYQVDQLQDEWDDLEEPIDDQIDALNRINDQIDRQITLLERERDNLVKPIDDQIAALEAARDIQDEQLELAEKQKAVEEARANLQNAQNERNIRYFNHETGHWEWMTDQKAIQSAQEGLEGAEKALDDYEYQMQINALERERDAIEKGYQEQLDALEAEQTVNDDIVYELDQRLLALEDKYKALMKPLEETIETRGEQLEGYEQRWADIELSHDKPEGDLASAIQGIASEGTVDAGALKQLMGDVTSPNEVDVTALLSKPVSHTTNNDLGQLMSGVMYGASGQGYNDARSYTSRAISNVNNNSNNTYHIAGMTFTQEQADTMHVSDLFSLAIYANQNR